jgi:hypothetical protein
MYVGKSWNVSACMDQADNLQKGSWVTLCVACAAIGDPNLLCRWLQKREACFVLVLFADVVFVGPRVMCQHDTGDCSGVKWVYLVLHGKKLTCLFLLSLFIV